MLTHVKTMDTSLFPSVGVPLKLLQIGELSGWQMLQTHTVPGTRWPCPLYTINFAEEKHCGAEP